MVRQISWAQVCIVMLSDPTDMVGGETAFRRKDGSIHRIKYPRAGWATVMQANHLFLTPYFLVFPLGYQLAPCYTKKQSCRCSLTLKDDILKRLYFKELDYVHGREPQQSSSLRSLIPRRIPAPGSGSSICPGNDGAFSGRLSLYRAMVCPRLPRRR